MRVQFRIDNFVNVELRSLSGSIHSTIYASIHVFIFIQGGRVSVGERMASSLLCATTTAHYVIRQRSPGLISGLGTKYNLSVRRFLVSLMLAVFVNSQPGAECLSFLEFVSTISEQTGDSWQSTLIRKPFYLNKIRGL